MTPPMGWNSWNKFGCNVNETIVRGVADAMVSSGMRDAGYAYVVVDDCWHGPRDADGNISADPERFPSGMRALGDYIHSRGLKFGLYSDAGRTTCGGRPGSQGHEFQDARTYASWGVDYLKYDWCATGTRNAEEAYALMADALRATGRDIVLSICEWGSTQPWLWAANIGNLWRTTPDIYDRWEGIDRWMIGVMNIVDRNEPLWPYAGPGHWNDADMLEVGNGGMTTGEYRAHFSLWAMMASPLIAGNDIAGMDDGDARDPDQSRSDRGRPGPARRPGPAGVARRRPRGVGQAAVRRRPRRAAAQPRRGAGGNRGRLGSSRPAADASCAGSRPLGASRPRDDARAVRGDGPAARRGDAEDPALGGCDARSRAQRLRTNSARSTSPLMPS